jgi:hypothetical protein
MQVRCARALVNFLFGPPSKLFALAILPLAVLFIWEGRTSLRLGAAVTRPARQGCEQSCRMVWSSPKPNLGSSCLAAGGEGTGRSSIVLADGGFAGATARFWSLSLVLPSSVFDIL